jgi:hypothetical protein
MATKSSLTFVAVFALVSMKKMPLSFEYVSASCKPASRAQRDGGCARAAAAVAAAVEEAGSDGGDRKGGGEGAHLRLHLTL